MDISTDNIAGVLLPSMIVRESEDSENGISQLGMDRGGQSIQRCREVFKELLDLLVLIASYQT